MKRALVAIFLLLVLAAALPAQALTINLTYDASVTSLTNAAQVETAIAAAAQVFQNTFTNSITVNITVYWGATGPFTGITNLGLSSTQEVGNPTYAQLTNALHDARESSADSNSVASLPAVDPTGGGTWWIPNAEAKALGLFLSPNDTNEDGAISLGANFSYTFDLTNRSVPGKIDAIGVAEHEISEVLGRNFGLNYLGHGYVPYDLFRFTSNGVRSFNPMDTNLVYFSVDNGATVLKTFYTNVNKGDIQDWLPGATPDAFDEASSSGHILPMSALDTIALDVLGYNWPGATAPNLTGVHLTNGSFRISFTNTPGAIFTILASTNVTLPATNWTVLGIATESPAGQFQFTDTVATNKTRFYRARWP